MKMGVKCCVLWELEFPDQKRSVAGPLGHHLQKDSNNGELCDKFGWLLNRWIVSMIILIDLSCTHHLPALFSLNSTSDHSACVSNTTMVDKPFA